MHLSPLAVLLAALVAVPVSAAEFNSVAECSVGAKVITRQGQRGRITRVDRDWSYCYVTLDDTGKEVGFLYSFLQPLAGAPAAGGSPAGGGTARAPGGSRLAVGTYRCYVGSEGAAMGLAITGPSSYVSDGQAGSFRLEGSGKIVFGSGPLSGFNAALLSGGRVGLNLSGGSFYNMTCDPPR